MTFVAPGSENRRGPYESSRQRARFSAEFIAALLRDFRQGGPAAIAKVRKHQPAAYMKICALLVPREMKVEHTNPLKEMSDEELDAAIAMVRELLEQRAAGIDAKLVIAGEVLEPAALPAPRRPQRKVSRQADGASVTVPVTSDDTGT